MIFMKVDFQAACTGKKTMLDEWRVFLQNYPIWFRLLVWLVVCGIHRYGCLPSVAKIKAKQPNKGDISGEYAQELKDKHASLGNLNHIGYTDFWLVKKHDLRGNGLIGWLQYLWGLLWVLFTAYLLFVDVDSQIVLK